MKILIFALGVFWGALLAKLVPSAHHLDFKPELQAGHLLQIAATIAVAYYIQHALRVRHEKGKGQQTYLVKQVEIASETSEAIRATVTKKNPSGAYAPCGDLLGKFRTLSNSLQHVKQLLTTLGEDDYRDELGTLKEVVLAMHEYKDSCTNGRLTADRRIASEERWLVLNQRLCDLVCLLLKR